jgi:hypothetical protein
MPVANRVPNSAVAAERGLVHDDGVDVVKPLLFVD